MRLSLKIAVLIGLGATLLVLLVSVASMRRDLRIVEDDIVRDAAQVANALAIASSGRSDAEIEALIRGVNATTDVLEVRYLRGPHDEGIVRATDSVSAVFPIHGAASGAIQVAESLAPRDRMLQGSLRSLVATTAVVILMSLGSGLWMGRSVVGVRVEELVRKARRVADGHFEEPIEIRGSDELTLLATELNLMAGQLDRVRREREREAEARLEAEIHLRHADRLRTVGQLAAGIAHELGTPLNVIGGRASMILRVEPEGTAIHKHATTIREQTARITAIVRRVMDFSRRAPAEMQSVRLDRLIEDTVALVRPTLKETDVRLEVPDRSWTLRADPEQIRQVVTNLLMNAAQATGSAGIVRLTLEDRGPWIAIRVEDDGPGCPPELRDRLLEPFYTTKEPGEGTGLGLSVVDSIVQDHGGTLEIGDSDLGGAQFTVLLPRSSTCPVS